MRGGPRFYATRYRLEPDQPCTIESSKEQCFFSIVRLCCCKIARPPSSTRPSAFAMALLKDGGLANWFANTKRLVSSS
jgi:hypothetical protein